MSVFKCTECLLRTSSPAITTRNTAKVCLSKRQRVITHGSQSIRQQRLFSLSQSKHADEPRPAAKTGEQPIRTVNMSTMFDLAVGDRRKSRTIQKSSSPSTSKDTAANSLTALLSKLGPTSAPISSLVDEQGNRRKALPLKLEAAPFRLGPVLGRTVQVDESRGRDVGTAFRVLETMVRRNGVKRDLMSQRFHERPGLKRKRLKSQRHRARFRQAFQETVTRVQAMRKMGW